MRRSDEPIPRRRFLKAGAVALGLPWFESSARAARKTPLRMLAICQDLGFIPSLFSSKGDGRDYKASPYLELLAEHRERFTVLSGLSHPEVDGSHKSDQSFLTSAPHPGRLSFRNSISLDQVAADHIGHLTRFRSLPLAVNLPKSLSFTQAGVEIPAIESASALFRKMFLQGDPEKVEEEVARLRRRGSVLDAVAEQARDVHSKLGSRDQQRLDQYQTAVRDLESRLVEQQEWERRPKPQTDAEIPTDPPTKYDYIEKLGLMFRMAKLALETDSTRLITLFIASASTPGLTLRNEKEYPWYHGLTHHGKDEGKLTLLEEIEVEHMRMLGELLRSLDSVEEEDGSLLDNTITLYGSNLSDANSHDTRNLPIILAGGGFRHGRHLAYDLENNTPLCNLYVNMLQRLGVETDKFGSSKGTLAEL